MKSNKLQRAVILVAGMLFLAAGAQVRADIGPPVKIMMPIDTKQAVSGKQYEGVFEIHVGRAGVLADFKLEGEGWTVLLFDTPSDPELAQVGTLRIPFRAVPEDADRPIRLSFTYNGRRVSKGYEVGPKYFGRAGKARAVQSVGVRLEEAFTVPIPKDPNQGYAAQSDSELSFRFTGRFVYTRSDGRTVGADNILVEVMDEDTDWDATIWSDYTKVDGTFDSGVISWEDCDLLGCEEEPDIYVRFECDTPVGQVQESGILEEDYHWDTIANVHEDFTGSEIDFGTITPSDSAEMPAVHIWNSLVRAHRYIKNVTGINVDHVDIQWPESENGAWYDWFFDEIHIGPNRQWNEGTHTHEYGHHFLQVYSVNVEPDYCNDYCDYDSGVPDCYDTDSEDCGHCQWCPETDHDAWNEGWPNWLADVVTRSYKEDYEFDDCTPYTALIPRPLEEPNRCCQDGEFHDPYITEGFAGALLRDIEDEKDDAHDDTDDDNTEWTTGPNTTDCMELGPEEIFDVVVMHQPETPAEFIDILRTWYSQEYTQGLWKTAVNVHPDYGAMFPADTAPPGPITSLYSPTHPSGEGGALPCITVAFGQPTDDVTGSFGFSVEFTTDPGGVVPPESSNWLGPCVTRAASGALDFGTYYVSIRAKDFYDHWGPPATFGPFVINGDCNNNGIIDLCDIECDAYEHAKDVGLLGAVPADFCDVAGCGLSDDCNLNAVPDECDLDNGTSKDCNLNGVPDECENLIHWADGDGSWHNPNNWYKLSECPQSSQPSTCDSPFPTHCPAVPDHADNVCINSAYSDITVTYTSDAIQVGALACYENLNIAGDSYPWADLTLHEASWVDGDLRLSLDNTVLRVNDRLDIVGLFEWTGSNISYAAKLAGPGVTYANGGVQIVDVVRLEGHLVLDGNSTSIITTGQIYFLGASSVFEISPGSTYEHQGSGYALRGWTGDTFDNNGTFIASVDTGTHQINVFTDNSGLIHVQDGTLSLHRGSSSTGDFLGDPGTTLEFLYGGHEFLPSSSIVADNVTFNRGNMVRGTYDVTTATTHSEHSLTFTSEANIISYGSAFYIVSGTVNFDAIVGESITFDTLSVGGTGYGTANFNSGDPVQATNLVIGPGKVQGPSTVTVSTLLTWGGSSGGAVFSGPGVLNVNGDMTIAASSTNSLQNRVLNNAGTATFLGRLSLASSAVFNNLASGVIDIQNDGDVFPLDTSSSFNNAGMLVKSAGAGTSTIAVHFHNSGIVEVQSGELEFRGYTLAQQTQTAGRTVLNGGDLAFTNGTPYDIQGGLLTGAGTITGNVLNAGGAVEPGLSVGTLQVDGNYTQAAAAALTIEIGGGPTCAAFDQLLITGTATLDGTLNIQVIDGCQPALDDTFIVLTSGQPLSGTFTDINGPALPDGLGFVPVYNTNDVILQVVPCVPPDWNCDECVEWIDFDTFVAYWQQTGCTATDWCNGADFSQDGTVNLVDFGEFAAHWLEGCP